ncbi:MAG: RNA-binding S4 domain-containing protein [Neisseriaceae bacterium]|nr:RNA-binding S4 domain-containing protein [Neisseriaceae bacterium]
MTQLSEMRLDKWLWAARFFKTRALAQKHIELGRVQVNGERVKNSKQISVGHVVDMTLNSLPYKFTVQSLSPQRRGAPEARLMYLEDQAVMTKRIDMQALNQAARGSEAYPDGRPTKRDRRQLDRVKRDWTD